MTAFHKYFIIGLFFLSLFGRSKANSRIEIIPIKHNTINNSITAIVQDDNECIWIGTMRGVMRFDGYSYKNFHNNPTCPLAKDVIRCMSKDRNGNIWIGANTGGAVYNKMTEHFTVFDSILKNISIYTIRESSSGLIVMGTERGVALVNPQTMNISYITETENSHLYADKISYSATDDKGNIWLASNNGFYRLTFPEGQSRPIVTSWLTKRHLNAFTVDPNNQIWFCDGEVLYKAPIPKDHTPIQEEIIDPKIEAKYILAGDKDVWIGTTYRGVYYFRLNDRKDISEKRELKINEIYENSLCNYVYTICRDRQERVWLGTIDGLFLVQETTPDLFKSITEESDGLSHNVVSCVCEGEEGNIWVGTSDGINQILFDSTGQFRITHYRDDSDMEHEILNNRIQTFIIDHNHIMWVGSRRGISYFDPVRKKFFRDKNTDTYLNAHDASFVKTFYQDSTGNIWVGLLYGGLLMYDYEKESFHKILLESQSIDQSNVNSVILDSSGNIWFGTRKHGLFRIDKKNFNPDQPNHFTNYTMPVNHPTKDGLPSNWITTLYCDRQGRLYVGTSEGICIYDSEKNTFRQITLNQSGENEYICSIIQDMNDAIWIFTSHGVYRYVPGSETPLFYEIHSGVFARIDYQANSCQTRQGIIFASGIKGVTYFDPENVKPDTATSPVYITNFSILNKEVIPGCRQLTENINHAKQVTLTHQDYQFSFEFSSFNYANPGGVKYAYRLEGFDKEWVYVDGPRNYVSYSNLPPGNYIFRVKATNLSGMWTDGSQDVLVRILPPWWATWWSILIYFAFSFGIFLLIFKIISTRIRYRRKEQENQWKQRFYMNVAHGLKTPLTLLQVPLNILKRDWEHLKEQDLRYLYSMMDKNVARISNMIYQLLEFNKIDRKRATLHLAEQDIVEFLREIHASFRELFATKEIDLTFQCNISSIKLTFDPEKMETVLCNLLLNAYTFTGKKYPEGGGKVTIIGYVDVEKQKFWISVKDNGTGIKHEHQHKIFERFWQIQDDNTLSPHGVGIGLSLSREYVEMHKGKIHVESEYGKGAMFSFYLLLGNSHFSSQYYIETNRKSGLSTRAKEVIESEMLHPFLSDEKPIEPQAPILYILSEDIFISDLLGYILQYYKIRVFNDAENFYAAVIHHSPALIIINLSSGNHTKEVKLCQKIRENGTLSFIPIILLTAEDNKDDILLYYEMGIDSFFEKPIDPSILLARVRSLLKNRKNIKEQMKLDIISNPKQEIIESADDKFMNRVMEVIEQNISNEEFSLTNFAQQMNMSRSVLHSRIQGLVNQSPIELLRSVRMKRAAQLLLSEAYNITQISYMIGFSDPRYFSTCFKKQYGTTPREYIRKHKNNEQETL